MRTFEELDVETGDRTEVRSLREVLDTLEMPVKEGQKCPFAGMGGAMGKMGKMFHDHGDVDTTGDAAKAKTAKTAKKADGAAAVDGMVAGEGGKCPFPFVLMHDPMSVVKDPSALLKDQSFWVCIIILVLALFASRM